MARKSAYNEQDLESMIDRLRRVWEEDVTPEVFERAALWYPRFRLLIEGRMAETDSTINVAAAVGITAVLSPQCHVTTNLDYLRTALAHRGAVDTGRFPADMMPKVRAMLAGNPATARGAVELAGGPKVRSFIRAILGDLDAVVADVHALGVAIGRPETKERPYKQWEKNCAIDAYRALAEALGEHARTLQAACWIAHRERDGQPRKADVHQLTTAEQEEAVYVQDERALSANFI